MSDKGTENHHEWRTRYVYGEQGKVEKEIEFCIHCLVVRRADDRNSPCKGEVGLSLRDRT